MTSFHFTSHHDKILLAYDLGWCDYEGGDMCSRD